MVNMLIHLISKPDPEPPCCCCKFHAECVACGVPSDAWGLVLVATASFIVIATVIWFIFKRATRRPTFERHLLRRIHEVEKKEGPQSLLRHMFALHNGGGSRQVSVVPQGGPPSTADVDMTVTMRDITDLAAPLRRLGVSREDLIVP